MYMGESEKVNEFALKVTTIINEIRSLGTKVEEVTVVEKLLHFVSNKFQPLVSTIEQWAISVAKTIGRLRAFEESSKGRRHDNEGDPQLLVAHAELRLTRAEWEAIVAQEKLNSKGSSGGINKNGVNKKYRGKFDKSKIDCRKCALSESSTGSALERWFSELDVGWVLRSALEKELAEIGLDDLVRRWTRGFTVMAQALSATATDHHANGNVVAAIMEMEFPISDHEETSSADAAMDHTANIARPCDDEELQDDQLGLRVARFAEAAVSK
ncbi:hypothetical protein E2562_022011 [Oryza meyeriana var. granulata]|uniref:Uncharacterized protein n=1 Tax=Oryza meyeriana var. granulata TaxID=110450 RepID=A0A6G1ENG4_9ORYZ|nr:hypothetical protein E2562_022011 [Oryza meyeriana var. granulata]